MYMVISLVLLSFLSISLAYHWHRRITSFKALLSTIKSRFGSDEVDLLHECGYSHCISHQWVLDYIVRGRESRIGNKIREFINNRTVIGFFVLGSLIWPTTAVLVVFFYRSFAFLGTSITIVIIAVFLIRASDNVNASYGLLAWMRTQDGSELNKNDFVYVTVSVKAITNWRTTLVVVAILSFVVAPWGELIPQVVALATSGLLITIFSLVYPPIAVVSHGIAVLAVLYLIPLAIALLYLIYGSVNRISTSLAGELLRNL